MKNVEMKLINPHPVNSQVYGDLDIENLSEAERIDFMFLVESIRAQGVLEPVVLDQNFTLISGERRYQACKFLELEMIPARQYNFENDLQRLAHLLDENIHRIKTNAQRIREGELREKILEATKKETLGNSSKTTMRDIVGDLIGLSGKTYSAGKDVLRAIDKLKKDGKPEEANKLKKKLNQSVNGATKLIKNEDEIIDGDFWYKPRLSAMIALMSRTIRGIQKHVKSDTPSAFMWFLQNITEDLDRYKSWIDGLEVCPVCKGTMYIKSGDACSVCIKGQVGTYTVNKNFEKEVVDEIQKVTTPEE